MLSTRQPSTWPGVAGERSILLQRMRREDLVRQLNSAAPSTEHDRTTGRLTYRLADGAMRYSLEVDFNNWLAVIDVSRTHKLLAVHILPPVN